MKETGILQFATSNSQTVAQTNAKIYVLLGLRGSSYMVYGCIWLVVIHNGNSDRYMNP